MLYISAVHLEKYITVLDWYGDNPLWLSFFVEENLYDWVQYSNFLQQYRCLWQSSTSLPNGISQIYSNLDRESSHNIKNMIDTSFENLLYRRNCWYLCCSKWTNSLVLLYYRWCPRWWAVLLWKTLQIDPNIGYI